MKESSPCIMRVQYIGEGGDHEYIGDITNTSGGVQQIGGISQVHRGCSVHLGVSSFVWVVKDRTFIYKGLTVT